MQWVGLASCNEPLNRRFTSTEHLDDVSQWSKAISDVSLTDAGEEGHVTNNAYLGAEKRCHDWIPETWAPRRLIDVVDT